MKAAKLGLTRVPTDDLKALLRAVHRGQLTFPLRRSDLMVLGMNRLADHSSALMGLDERAVRTVIALVVAERNARTTPT